MRNAPSILTGSSHEAWAADPARAPAPVASTVAHVLEHAVDRWPDALAFACGDVSATFRDIARLAETAQSALTLAGCRPGDRVAVWAANSLEWVAWYFGVARLAGVLVPLHTRWTAAEAAGVIEQAAPAALIVGAPGPGSPAAAEVGALLHRLDGAAGGPHVLDAALPSAPGIAPPAHLADPLDTAMIKFTSGSTSAPKGVRLGHAAIVRCAHNAGLRLGLVPGDVLFSALPLFHAGGSILSVLTSYSHGAGVVTQPRFDADAAVAAIRDHGCTAQIGMDIMFIKEMTSPVFSRAAVRTLRTGWIAAASPAAAARVHDAFGVPFVSVYGMTETSANACMTAVTDPDELRLGWHGAPQPGLEVGVFDPELGVPVAQGATGAIRVRGWAVHQGYLGAGPPVDREGWFDTGDLGIMGESGYLRFVGRSREMLKVGGENVACAEVEATLDAHPEVAMAYLSAMPDATYGELPVAFVEREAGGDVSEDELIEWCRRDLARFKVPRRIVFVERDEWPITGPEKVSRSALRARAAELAAEGADAR